MRRSCACARVRVLSQGVFHGPDGDLVAVEQHLPPQLEDLYPTALRMAVYHLGRREEVCLFQQSSLLLVKTRGMGPAVPHFLTQMLLTQGPLMGLAILWWLVNLLEDPTKDTDDTHMDIDSSCSMWALYYGRRPDLISLSCIHLPVPLNCAWGVLSDGPYPAADVVNLLKASVKGRRRRMLSGGLSCTEQAQASRCSSSRSPLTRQLARGQ